MDDAEQSSKPTSFLASSIRTPSPLFASSALADGFPLHSASFLPVQPRASSAQTLVDDISCGVGITFKRQMVDADYQVESINAVGPVSETGLVRVGDRVIEIDGVKVDGQTFADVCRMLRGAEGSWVVITFEREASRGFKVKVRRRPLREVSRAASPYLHGKSPYVLKTLPTYLPPSGPESQAKPTTPDSLSGGHCCGQERRLSQDALTAPARPTNNFSRRSSDNIPKVICTKPVTNSRLSDAIIRSELDLEQSGTAAVHASQISTRCATSSIHDTSSAVVDVGFQSASSTRRGQDENIFHTPGEGNLKYIDLLWVLVYLFLSALSFCICCKLNHRLGVKTVINWPDLGKWQTALIPLWILFLLGAYAQGCFLVRWLRSGWFAACQMFLDCPGHCVACFYGNGLVAGFAVLFVLKEDRIVEASAIPPWLLLLPISIGVILLMAINILAARSATPPHRYLSLTLHLALTLAVVSIACYLSDSMHILSLPPAYIYIIILAPLALAAFLMMCLGIGNCFKGTNTSKTTAFSINLAGDGFIFVSVIIWSMIWLHFDAQHQHGQVSECFVLVPVAVVSFLYILVAGLSVAFGTLHTPQPHAQHRVPPTPASSHTHGAGALILGNAAERGKIGTTPPPHTDTTVRQTPGPPLNLSGTSHGVSGSSEGVSDEISSPIPASYTTTADHSAHAPDASAHKDTPPSHRVRAHDLYSARGLASEQGQYRMEESPNPRCLQPGAREEDPLPPSPLSAAVPAVLMPHLCDALVYPEILFPVSPEVGRVAVGAVGGRRMCHWHASAGGGEMDADHEEEEEEIIICDVGVWTRG